MPRRREVVKRPIIPDPKFHDKLVTQFVNVMMRDGKKSTAETIMYDTLDILEERTGEDPIKVFKKAVDNCKPAVEVRSRRVGGSTYQVPVEVRQDRRTALSLRWLIQFARARSEKTMVERLAGELLDATNNRGNAIRKKDEVHRMADANKAFAHYRW
ncbi:30S ribosomal protein S7 [Microvenator marinus]|jgi:small subunit ribosomal protein S7|uniref:Small ribosomal subunit protein uS7 n=1 Tax=Microvenator marinus TaxID=2600177 RepID=A0A5B8XTZ3_9DELT|nr:30S ribosomal protein S7 [Microvenator marinus]QED28771.1 30S ribosomal protein S7 [Microvenator marinus]